VCLCCSWVLNCNMDAEVEPSYRMKWWIFKCMEFLVNFNCHRVMMHPSVEVFRYLFEGILLHSQES
jgi:hypothetical protein